MRTDIEEGMVESSAPAEKAPAAPRRAVVIASALLPVLMLAGMVFLLLRLGPGLNLGAPAPVEQVDFERVELHPGRIRAHVINSGPEAVTIAQVQVGWTNRASWEFSVHPSATVPRLGRAVVEIPYPWVAGEPYEIVLITEKNLIFTHDIEVAAETPVAGGAMLATFAMLGLYVGVIPVFLGIAWLPFLRSLPARWYTFILSLTVGLLVFLGVDALHEAMENTAHVPGPFQGTALILIGVSLSLLGLYAVAAGMKSRSRGDSGGPLLLAYSIAFGIGVHNLGEGLAIGSAYALGAVSVGALLILGFTLHNLTEGVAIVAPVVQKRTHWSHLVWMGAIAGGPTIAGTILGATAYSPTWAVLFLAIGAGAVFQVVIEITRYQVKSQGGASLAGAYSIAGFFAGLAIMYVTGLFVSV
jgi:zinc transporter ZupT